MAESVGRLLARLEGLRGDYGGDASRRKLALIDAIASRPIARPRDLLRLHEALCFLRAYPDDRRLLATVERLLAAFPRRGDLRRHRDHLADSGIAGTTIDYAFFYPTACWLADRWPGRFTIRWGEFDASDRLPPLLHLLLPYASTMAVDEVDHEPPDWIDELRDPSETDAAFLVRCFRSLAGDEFLRESLFDPLVVPFRLSPGKDTPSRTSAKLDRSKVFFRNRPLSRQRPDLAVEARTPPLAVRALTPGEGRRVIGLAREAMLTRSRELDAFSYADERDVRMIDCGEGLQFACMGMRPARRLMLESVYAFLTLRNGVPIGYVLCSSLFGSSGIAYNVFDTFRGVEAGAVFGRVIATVAMLFGSDAFSIDPYQLGYDNDEGLKSGAWWFYYKLGFRPEDPAVGRVLRGELARMKKDPAHRTGTRNLRRLASENIYLYLGRRRDDALGKIDLWRAGILATRALSRLGGVDWSEAGRKASSEAARLVGLRSLRSFSGDERLAWERWSPLILSLPGVAAWRAEEKRALVRVVRAKGGRRESDFVRMFDDHPRLRRAVLSLTR